MVSWIGDRKEDREGEYKRVRRRRGEGDKRTQTDESNHSRRSKKRTDSISPSLLFEDADIPVNTEYPHDMGRAFRGNRNGTVIFVE